MTLWLTALGTGFAVLTAACLIALVLKPAFSFRRARAAWAALLLCGVCWLLVALMDPATRLIALCCALGSVLVLYVIGRLIADMQRERPHDWSGQGWE